ncbi:CPBP family intramembrane glutamic endopeptidase [Novilysobacter defluvii]|uniref:CAAX protease n=1 Tax=Lysobacter defluvii IMMIB APB-9 = DSM 18482 TaxID=1385515 RepID=A0A0A0MAT5_9GAMM|nr:CPBP family intramembrane glutamic endopeptidase [Lysobacter defluvii]KGO99544.1 CAAX protease [Lysobacter defluvii IMMIB APB-9 = DSM 18482]
MSALKTALRATLLLLAAWVAWTFAFRVGGMPEPGPLQRLLTGLLVTLTTLAVLALLLRVDRLRWSDLRMAAGRAAMREFALGALVWLVPAALAVMALAVAGLVRIEPLSGAGPVLATLAWLLPAVLLGEAIPEELAFRGYLQGMLGRRLAPWLAVLLQALAFTAFAWLIGALSSPQAWMFIPGLGVILGVVRALSGSPWMSMGMHAAWMTTTQLLVAQGHFQVVNQPLLLFAAFTLAPAVVAGVLFDRLRGGFDWLRPAPLPRAG